MMHTSLQSQWLIHQLSDSAFPIGGFAHSSGTEAVFQLGLVDSGQSLESLLSAQLRQVARLTLPFVLEASRSKARLVDLDAIYQAMLSNHVARRASISQGQALILATSRSFPCESLKAIYRDVKEQKLQGHLAPLFGACGACLGLSESDIACSFAFIFVRGIVSAAVRLGIVGPMEGQAIQWKLRNEAADCVHVSFETYIDQAAQTAPLLDLFQGMQDRLYSRLFQS